MKVIILKGIPASGKSTYAKAWVNEDPTRRIRINNDNIREMLGPYWIPQRENLVNKIWQNILHESLTLDYDVIIDNMNLNPRVEKQIYSLIKDFNTDVEIKKLCTPVEECIERDKNRTRSVGEHAIRGLYNRYKDEFK